LTEQIEVKVNGKVHLVSVKPYDTLSRVLREEIGLTGTKRGCDYGGCGACTVSVDGMPVYSCMYPAQYCVGKEIATVEGLSGEGNVSRESLTILQRSFLVNGGLQCGYCTDGILISAERLLSKNPEPTVADVKEALAGNICRCTGYGRIIESVMLAASEMRASTETGSG
jgi:carbon-monoxide dehydrogenase small subunit